MDSADYDSLLEAARAVQSDPQALQELFMQRLPQYLAPAKRSVGRHPDTQITFLVLESLGVSDQQKRIVLGEQANIGGQRTYLATSWKLKSAKDYTGGYASPQFGAQKSIPVETCKSLLAKLMPKDSDELLAAAKNAAGDKRVLQALFAKHLPHYQEKPKRGVGHHPDSNAAFLVLEILGFGRSEMTNILLCAEHTVHTQREALKLGKNLPSAEDFTAGRHDSYASVGMTKRLSVEKCKALSLFVISEQTYDALRTQAEAVKRDTKALQALFSKHIPAFQNKPKANRVRHPHVYVAFLVLESIASIPAVMTETLDHQNLGHIRTSLHSTNKLMSVAEASAWRSGQMYRSPKTSQSKTEPKAKTELERKPTPEKPVEVSRTELAIESLKKAKSLSDVYGAASKFFPAWRRTEAGVPHGDNQELLLAFHEAGFPNADIQSVMLSNTGDVDERLKAAGRTPNKAPNRFAPNSAAA